MIPFLEKGETDRLDLSPQCFTSFTPLFASPDHRSPVHLNIGLRDKTTPGLRRGSLAKNLKNIWRINPGPSKRDKKLGKLQRSKKIEKKFPKCVYL
jgi:hypothetical protein